jgi:hypothetical protein
MDTTPQTTLRELDHRRSDGIDVTMLWDSAADRILIEVNDGRSGEAFTFEVERGEALSAFQHPFAYASPSVLEPAHG